MLRREVWSDKSAGVFSIIRSAWVDLIEKSWIIYEIKPTATATATAAAALMMMMMIPVHCGNA